VPCVRDVGDQKEGAAVDLRNTKLVHGLFHDHLTVPRHPLEVRQPELTGEKKSTMGMLSFGCQEKGHISKWQSE
jgi:hypothetical protein